MIILTKLNNSKSGNNGQTEFLENKQKTTHTSEKFCVPSNPSAVPWDPTPNTPEEMVNTYGTYEIQPTNATDCDFPAITQGLPSENIMHHPSNFSEGVVPKLNKLEKDKP